MSDAQLRTACTDDDDALRELARDAVITAGLAVWTDRRPTFRSLADRVGKRHETIVAVEQAGGGMIGSISVTLVPMSLCGTVEPVAVVGDLRVRSDWRDGMISRQLVDAARLLSEEWNATCGIASVFAANERVLRMFDRLLPDTMPLGQFEVQLVLPHRALRMPRRAHQPLAVRAARDDDVAAISELQRTHAQSHDFVHAALADNPGWVGQLRSAHPTSLRTLVAETTDGVLVGTLTSWDQRHLQQHVLAKHDASTRALTWASRVRSIAHRGVEVPHIGSSVAFRHLVFPASIPGYGALTALVDHELDQWRCGPTVAGMIGVPKGRAGNDIRAALRGRLHSPVRSQLVGWVNQSLPAARQRELRATLVAAHAHDRCWPEYAVLL